MLSKPTIAELQEILKEELGEDFSYEEVAEIAVSLVSYVETLKEINTN
jgi:hypothetical protein